MPVRPDDTVTIVVPAYNEEERLPSTLAAITAYLAGQQHQIDVIVVDDGSVDRSAAIVEQFAADHPNVALIRNPHCGKAFAVRTGMLAARGDWVFLCDADLSMPISELTKFLHAADDDVPVVIGSREAHGALQVGTPYYRYVMGRVFNWLVRVLILGDFQDTQCGFKLFRRDLAHSLFNSMRLYAAPNVVQGPMVTGFDVEILYLARRAGYPVKEIGIEWHYDAGTKVRPFTDSTRMLRDIVRVRLNDLRGLYGR